MTSCLLLAVSIVSGGVPKACVVVPPDAPRNVRFCADELARWTKELTGAAIPVGTTAAAGLAPVTFRLLPDDGDARVRHDGFRVTAGAAGVEIAAKEPVGLTFGTYWVLNRFGKVFWFDPESGADFAKTDSFEVPDGTFVETPLPVREGLRAGGAKSDLQDACALWNVRNGFQDANGSRPELRRDLGLPVCRKAGGHVLGDLVVEAPVRAAELDAEVARIRASGENRAFLNPAHAESARAIEMLARFRLEVKRHPHRFPLIDGKRVPTGVSLLHMYRGKVGNPCLSSLETREYMLSAIRAQKAADVARFGPVRFEYGFMCDDNSQWCECDACMRLIRSKGAKSDDDRASDYWWDFLNWMTPRLLEDRDVSVEAALYLNYRQPPTRVKPLVVDPARQSVLVCPHGRCYFHSLADRTCKANERYRRMFADWKGLGVPIHVFEYHCQLPGKGNYAFIERAWVDDLRWYRAHGAAHAGGGLFGPWVTYSMKTFPPEKTPIYSYGAKARWLSIWLTGHFSWDADDDFETVRADALRRYYRAAAPEMVAYRRLLEGALKRANICMSYGSSGLPFTVAATEEGLVEKAKGLLTRAAGKAGADAELRRRIERDRQNFYRDWESAAELAANVRARPLRRASEAIALDGALDEATWGRAAVSDDWRWAKRYNVDAKAPDPFVPLTKMRLAHDDDCLYLAFECEKTKGREEIDLPPDGSAFEAMRGSHLELCVQAPSQDGEYFHLALSHNGKTYSAQTANPTMRDLAKTCDFTFAIRDGDARWTAELALPFASFGAPPKPGETWRICAYRTAPGAEGGTVEGTSTGFPLHWMDRWEAFSFGVPGNLVRNGSFEAGAPPPQTQSNGTNWVFRQERAPAGWNYHPNGGDLDWRTDDPPDGRRYVRVAPVNAMGGPEFLVTPTLAPYPPDARALHVSFWARGRGTVRLYSFGAPKLAPVNVSLDSAGWKRYEIDLPLGGTHPQALTVRFFSPEKAPIDFDDLVAVPVRGGTGQAGPLPARPIRGERAPGGLSPFRRACGHYDIMRGVGSVAPESLPSGAPRLPGKALS